MFCGFYGQAREAGAFLWPVFSGVGYGSGEGQGHEAGNAELGALCDEDIFSGAFREGRGERHGHREGRANEPSGAGFEDEARFRGGQDGGFEVEAGAVEEGNGVFWACAAASSGVGGLGAFDSGGGVLLGEGGDVVSAGPAGALCRGCHGGFPSESCRLQHFGADKHVAGAHLEDC